MLNDRARQPIHVVYGGAQRFKADTAQKLGAIALDTMRSLLPAPAALADITGIDACVAEAVHPRIAAKLEREPVEDFRIDFEDGYGVHSDTEEDADAEKAAEELARGLREHRLPSFIGVRLKPMSAAVAARATRTLDLFMTRLLDDAGRLPANFAVTLPKITAVEEVTALGSRLSELESRFRLGAGTIRTELMVEAPQVIVSERGVCLIPAMIEASEGRCRGIHFGPYDYTSAIGITSARQTLSHPACDFARHFMQAAAAASGVFVSDGPTKLIPVRGAAPQALRQAMRAQYDDVRRSLDHGFYQGWDLHPAQFPMRYAAVYSFFLEAYEAAASRLRNFIDGAAQATLLGTVFDDIASGQGLVNFFLRGWNCGALTEAEIELSGITVEELRGRSFAAIVESRRR
jgi:citrate lyase beta subunit